MQKGLTLDYVLIGDRLQKGRGKTATQEYVAEMVGCSSNYLSSIECGKKKFPLNCYAGSVPAWIFHLTMWLEESSFRTAFRRILMNCFAS